MSDRQTDLSLNQILDLLKKGNSHFPSCLLLNELGVICRKGQDEDGAGEKHLLSVLNHENPNKKVIAFCCLSLIPGANEKHAAIIEEFRNNPENQDLLFFADDSIARFKAELEDTEAI